MAGGGADTGSPSAWDTIVAEAKTLHGAPNQTLKPAQAGIGTTGREVLAAYGHTPDRHVGLRLREVLGEGGRGIVHLAEQRSLGREVAVKALRPDLRKPGPTLELLQEAWIAGRLEHPNIIPVYDIDAAEDGSPLIVLKRIEGEPWSRLLADGSRADDLLGARAGERLEAHLQVLLAVCNALHYAHDRRILHLDLKPDNVMIGGHGEVYVADWGVAAALEDPSGSLPLCAKRTGIVGTPAYMAPEMAYGDGARLDERTDVYLIGAMLFELLAGRPPHGGETIMAVLYAVVHDEPALPDDAPDELAAICRKAMARDPEARFASVEGLREALLDFLRHRGSARLAEQAAARLDQLEAALGGHQERPSDDHRELFAGVRFGFEQALASWPDNAVAREGLARAFTAMIEHELEHGDPLVGADLAAHADALPPDLRARLDAAVERRRASLSELEQLRHDADMRIGQRTRVFVFTLMGLVWSVLPLIEHFVHQSRGAEASMKLYVVGGMGSLLAFTALFVWARDSLTRTRVNRAMVATVFIALLTHLLMFIGGLVLGLMVTELVVLLLLVGAAIIAVAAVSFEPRGLIIAGANVVGFAIAAWRPSLVFLCWSAVNLCFVIVLGILWWPARIRGAIPERDHRA